MRLASDTLDVLSDTWYFLTLDMKPGYWRIELHPLCNLTNFQLCHLGLPILELDGVYVKEIRISVCSDLY